MVGMGLSLAPAAVWKFQHLFKLFPRKHIREGFKKVYKFPQKGCGGQTHS